MRARDQGGGDQTGLGLRESGLRPSSVSPFGTAAEKYTLLWSLTLQTLKELSGLLLPCSTPIQSFNCGLGKS